MFNLSISAEKLLCKFTENLINMHNLPVLHELNQEKVDYG